jgi:dimeric dUTPase (all-alpha-NTP-PPase superfamily)
MGGINVEMTLEKMYEMQKALDARIIKEKGLEGIDLLPNTVLALQVEISELANEWRGFKHWSNDREPRTSEKDCFFCSGGDTDCPQCHGRNPLLEEYVDCLHFFLSLARQLELPGEELNIMWEVPTQETVHLFSDLLTVVGLIDYNDLESFYDSWKIFNLLGTRLGFTFDQIAEAYVAKNRVNHERQANGY